MLSALFSVMSENPEADRFHNFLTFSVGSSPKAVSVGHGNEFGKKMNRLPVQRGDAPRTFGAMTKMRMAKKSCLSGEMLWKLN
jgi:hypothetical protein